MNKIFCELCGNLLAIKNENEKYIGKCSCGFTKEIESGISFSDKSQKKNEIAGGIFVKADTIGFPHKCKKCNHEQCDIWDLGAQYSDESNIYLYKCKKCGFVERQADGSSNT